MHGFLGPNGSGKTTTIKMLLGLARPTKGEMRLFGLQVPAQLPQVIDRVGAIVEEPRFFPTFSGRKNLTLLARSIGVPRTTVDAALQQVGLADRARERLPGPTRSGMKQRLAIAAALLKSPDLLILDEPTNGLDPAGIRGIRDLIRDLGRVRRDRPAELAHPRRGAAGVPLGLDRGRRSAARLRPRSRTCSARTSPAPASASPTRRARRHFLEAAGYAVTRRGATCWSSRATSSPSRSPGCWPSKGVYVSELTAIRPTLESFFLKLTGRQPTGPPDAATDDSPDDEEAS